MKRVVILISCVLCVGTTGWGQQSNYDEVVAARLQQIRAGLDTAILVKRFEAIETPCFCIDATNDAVARHYPNSNYKIRARSGRIDSGYLCLNEYNAQYLKFKPDSVGTNPATIKGKVEFSYGYPAGSIIQYLGFTEREVNKDHTFFERLTTTSGTFTMYPEDDKWRVEVIMNEAPFDPKDKYYGYVEIVRDEFSQKTGFIILFDKMSLDKGDKDNQISLRFGSTTHNDESMYYSRKIYEVLKHANSTDVVLKAKAVWLYSFLNDANCAQTKYVYRLAVNLLNSLGFQLPNTKPFPPH